MDVNQVDTYASIYISSYDMHMMREALEYGINDQLLNQFTNFDFSKQRKILNEFEHGLTIEEIQGFNDTKDDVKFKKRNLKRKSLF